MQASKIRQGRYYETTHGHGECLQVSQGRIEMLIRGPLPLGRRYLKPREVLFEIDHSAKTAESSKSR